MRPSSTAVATWVALRQDLTVEELIARRPDLRLLTAVNGTLGIALARASQPEMILMDVNLPDISGIEAMRILREDPVTAHIPIVALSANAMPRDIRRGLEAGFFRYLTSPSRSASSWTRCAWRWNLPNSGPQKKGVH